MRRSATGALVENSHEPLPVGTREERVDELIYRAISIYATDLLPDQKQRVLDVLKDQLYVQCKMRKV